VAHCSCRGDVSRETTENNLPEAGTTGPSAQRPFMNFRESRLSHNRPSALVAPEMTPRAILRSVSGTHGDVSRETSGKGPTSRRSALRQVGRTGLPHTEQCALVEVEPYRLRDPGLGHKWAADIRRRRPASMENKHETMGKAFSSGMSRYGPQKMMVRSLA
jgi:hypothetical protein